MATGGARVPFQQSLPAGIPTIQASLALEASAACPGPGGPLLYSCERSWGRDQGHPLCPLSLFLL